MSRTRRLEGKRRRVAEGVEVLQDARVAFKNDRARRLSAGLAYYSVFALIPTLFLVAAIATAIVGQEAADGRLVQRLDHVVGATAAEQIEEAVASLDDSTATSAFALISVGAVVYSASVLFVAWRDILESIWGVPYASGLASTIRSRAFGALVPIAAGLLFAAVVLLELVVAFAEQLLSVALLDALVRVAGTVIPTVVAIVALGLLYRRSARTQRPEWRDVWPGTILASVALGVATWGYGLYVRFVGSTSLAGAASAVLVGLVFIYYSAQILLFGAEVIGVLRDRRNQPDQITARAGAPAVTDGPRPCTGRRRV